MKEGLTLTPLSPLPRIFIAAPHSGSGKTTLTCGLLAALRKRGLRVQACKIGPDYIDPGYLASASGRPAHNLDTWLMSSGVMSGIFARRAAQCDLTVVEGVMGLYDGGRGGVSSTAEIAKILKAPVILVMDVRSMGDSAAAIALGFREYDRDVSLQGVILNRVGSPSHEALIRESMRRVGIPVLGAVARDDAFTISERHLGLLPTDENQGHSFDALSETMERSLDIDGILAIAAAAPPLPLQPLPQLPARHDVRIAVARDQAFSFYYPESLRVLEEAGAELVFFSPLTDSAVPPADGVILGGGFPEMFARQLAANDSMKRSILQCLALNMPLYAECGGYMYLTRGIRDFEGTLFPMVGAVPALCRMEKKLQTVGYVEAESLFDSVLCPKGTVVRGHEFHFSSAQIDESALGQCAWRIVRKRTGAASAGGFTQGSLTASYLHLHFAGCPELAENFVSSCRRWRERGGR